MPKDDLDLTTVQKEYDKTLSMEPQYSLNVDPKNEYNLLPKEKQFVKYMVELNDINQVGKILKLNEFQIQTIYFKYGVREEIVRIKSAIRHRQCSRKMLTLSELGGYASSMIMDEGPEYEKIDAKTKVKYMDIVLKIHDAQSKVIDSPEVLDIVPEATVADVKNCSAEELRAMLDVIKGGK